ncbi:MAG: DUF3667 domain-containing protein [Chlorobi bacterium]|nr:DUF3667 domain-containing protein [Chlorobiota bacterium]
METNTKYCKNCGHPLEKEYKYCPECGQKAEEDLTIKELFHNTISNYFSVDARFFRSFLPLLFRPGYLPVRFVEGKRMTYLHPTQFYLFVSVVFFFLLSFNVREQEEKIDKSLKTGIENINNPDTSELKVIKLAKADSILAGLKEKKIITGTGKVGGIDIDSVVQAALHEATDTTALKNRKISFKKGKSGLVRKFRDMARDEKTPLWKRKFARQLLKIYNKRGSGFLQVIYGTVPIAMFVLLPVFALLLKLLFFKTGRYSYHLVFSFYFFSFLFMFFSLYLIAGFFFPVPGRVFNLCLLLAYIYLLVAMIRFYKQSVFRCFMKSLALLFVYFLFIVPTSGGILIIVSLLIY